MAVWGIDIGKSALKAIKLRATKEGLEIQAIEHLPYPVEDDEDERQEHVNDAIRTFLTKYKFGGDQIVVAIPGLHAFSRFINLPPVDKSKIGLMVRMEAQQQIPFPIAEVNWDFVKIERDYAPGEEIEVGIFATRSELIDGFLRDLGESSLSPDIVTIAPLAVYNFLRYNQADAEGATVILDIGAEHTDLVIVDGERFWIRNLRIAGNDITKALAERFKIPFAEAEKLKKSSSKSQQAKKIFGAMEPVLKDLVGEVHRSVGFFKSQADDLDIKRMVLLGDGSKLKNLTKFLAEQLKYDVTRVQRLEQDKFLIEEDVDLDVLKNHILGFGVALGLAIQGVKQARCSINLAPQALQVQSKLKSKLPLAIAAAACTWAALGLSWVYWNQAGEKLTGTLQSIKKIEPYAELQQKATSAMEELAPLQEKADALVGIGKGRTLILDFLDQLRQVMPAENGKIPELSSQEREQDLDHQIQIYLEKLEKEKTWSKKRWLLDWSIRAVPGEGGGEQPYKVTMHIAQTLPQGDSPASVRESIKSEFVNGLTSRLEGAPFYVRNDQKIPKKYGEIDVGTPVEIYRLDPNARVDPGRKAFFCVMVELSFEIGVPPKQEAPAPQEGE